MTQLNNISPPQTRTQLFRYQILSTTIAIIGWYLFAFSASFSTAGSNTGLGLIMVGSFLSARLIWKDVKYKPVFWATIIFSAYIIVHSAVATHFWPELNEISNPHWTHLLRMSGLLALIMGWWVYRNPTHLPYLLLTAVIGIITGVVYKGNIDTIIFINLTNRATWGHNPNYLGMISGSTILGLLAWLLLPTAGRIVRPAWYIGAPLILLMGLFLYTSQSRSSWLGFILGIFALTLIILKHEISTKHKRSIFIGNFYLILLFFIVLMFSLFQGDLFIARISQEWSTVSLILSGEITEAAEAGGSVGYRIALWLAGLAAFFQRPILGWGIGAGEFLLDGKITQLNFQHFHNLYLEILVGLGLIGSILATFVAGLLLRDSLNAARSKALQPAYVAGLFTITVCIGVALLFTIRIGQTEGRAALTMLMAIFSFTSFLSSDQSTN